jgi:FkbM family methyltransferase
MIKEKIHNLGLQLLATFAPKRYKAHIFKNFDKARLSNLEKFNLTSEPLLINYLLKKEEAFFDVGAHHGEFIYYALKKLPAQNIYAFEPNRTQYSKLVKIFKRVNIFDLGLSNLNGTLEFKIPIINGKTVTTRGTLKTNYVEKEEQKHILLRIKVRTIDSFVEEHGINNLGLIKVDVEGAEMDVIEGAKKTIQRDKPNLILELEKRHLGGSIVSSIQKIKDLGYECYYFDFSGLKIRKLDENPDIIQDETFHKVLPVKYINNFIFIHRESQYFREIEAINDLIKNEA